MTSDSLRRAAGARRLGALALSLGGALLVLAGVGCGGDGGATPVTPVDSMPTLASGLQFLRAAGDAPALANPTLAFWARKGRDEEHVIWYRPRPGRTDSTEFLRFRLDARSLTTGVDGSTLADGDSVLITIAVTDPVNLVAAFQPAGLRFASGREARLRFKFLETSEDRDGDGDVDAQDAAHTSELAVWKQEGSGQPWVQVPSTLTLESDEVEGRLPGFTNYAVAYRK